MYQSKAFDAIYRKIGREREREREREKEREREFQFGFGRSKGNVGGQSKGNCLCSRDFLNIFLCITSA